MISIGKTYSGVEPPRLRLARLGLAGLCGGLIASGQPPWGLWPVALLGVAGLLYLACRGGLLDRCLALWAAGALHFAITLQWIPAAFPQSWSAQLLAWGAMSCGLALYWGAAGCLSRHPLGLAAALGLGEALRGVAFGGFPWAGFGMSLVDTPVLGLAAVGGPLLVTAVFLLTAGLLAQMAQTGRVGHLWMGGLGLAALVVTPVMLPGPIVSAEPPLRVRILRTDFPSTFPTDPLRATLVLTALIDATFSAGAGVDLVLWPETASPLGEVETAQALAALWSEDGPTWVVAGVRRDRPDGMTNSLVAIDRQGTVTPLHDKVRLTPFGETLPPGLDRLIDAGLVWTPFVPGAPAGAMELAGLPPLLALICYEGLFAADARTSDARAILLATSETWLGRGAGLEQHLAHARFRAVETGRPVLRAANAGIAALIDAQGRVTRAPGQRFEAVLDVDLPAARRWTPYGVLGDWPVLVALGLLLAAGRRRMEERQPEGWRL